VQFLRKGLQNFAQRPFRKILKGAEQIQDSGQEVNLLYNDDARQAMLHNKKRQKKQKKCLILKLFEDNVWQIVNKVVFLRIEKPLLRT
jgi:hypothetical protein